MDATGNEALLQYLWEYRLIDYSRCFDTDGRPITVIDPGLRNNDSGPDFFNAKIRLDGRIWAGNIEIHNRASDWHAHGHDSDPAYHTVILHVVAVNDCTITRPDGTPVPQMILPFAPDFHDRYKQMVYTHACDPACANDFSQIPSLLVTEWMTALGFDRLYAKSERVLDEFRQTYDWRTTAYITLARALGFGTNSQPMEQLARITPLDVLMRHRDDPDMVEAALLGQAGLLEAEVAPDDSSEAEYYMRLQSNYRYLQRAYDLPRDATPQWKYSRMRPDNFPHRRIATLAALMADGFYFGRHFHSIASIEQARDVFKRIRLSAYWTEHSTLGRRTAALRQPVSQSSADVLIINALIPLIHAYGTSYNNDRLCDTAADMLQALPPENNFITRMFGALGIKAPDAFTSQAMIELRRSYCEPRKCIYCRFGRRILTAKARPKI